MKKTTYIYDTLKKALRDDYTARERTKLSVSDTGCILQRQLKLWKVKPDREPTDSELITFFFGDHLHKAIQYKTEGEDEIELEDEHFIGHIDKGTIEIEDGLIVVNEFKSIKDYGIDMLEKEGDQPKDEHIRQATNYVRMLIKKLGAEKVAKYFRIIYVAKCFDDNHRKFLYEKKNPELANGGTTIRMVEYTVPYDPKLATEIVKEAIKIELAVKTMDVLPCSEWGKVYHRNDKWNSYLSWCKATPEQNAERLLKLKEEK